ncbi:MAG: hypothetical protein ABSB56_08435 [Nitrososphaerales archaeon]
MRTQIARLKMIDLLLFSAFTFKAALSIKPAYPIHWSLGPKSLNNST